MQFLHASLHKCDCIMLHTYGCMKSALEVAGLADGRSPCVSMQMA